MSSNINLDPCLSPNCPHMANLVGFKQQMNKKFEFDVFFSLFQNENLNLC